MFKLIDEIPNNFGKQEFIALMKKIGVANGLFSRVEALPDIIHYNGHDYKLNISCSWHREDGTYYEFEMNYYAEDIMEFLLTYKIFRDIEVSLNYLECELMRRGFIDVETECPT